MSAYPPPPPSYGSPKKGMAITSLVLGIIGVPTVGCLGVGAIAGIILGILALMKANRSPAEYGGKGMAIAGIVLSGLAIPCGGIWAAIAIPSLLRARVSANEAGTIGDIRTVISGQAMYQSQTGSYGTLECLARPGGCIPGYNGPTFLDTSLAAAGPKNGYMRTFHAGPPATAESSPTGMAAPGGLMSFAYVAVPVTRNQTGVRAFGGDARGVICYPVDGTPPQVVDGACQLTSCTPLQ